VALLVTTEAIWESSAGTMRSAGYLKVGFEGTAVAPIM
jgi:hypothetical protein